jgi:molybdate transport system ATP-binding protein
VDIAIGSYFRSMAENFLTLTGVSVQLGGAKVLDGLDWTIRKGEQWALTGASGSGKTVLAQTLLGRHFAGGRIDYFFGGVPVFGAGPAGERSGVHLIAMVEQQHRFKGRPGATELYYQQRFNAADADKTITVEQELAEYAGWSMAETAGEGKPACEGIPAVEGLTAGGAGRGEEWLDHLHIRPLLKKRLIQLSNGENKRVQLAIALLEEPVMLILDNPFLGLDIEGRATLHTIINRLASGGMQILLITGAREIPGCITHVARLDKGKWAFLGTVAEGAVMVSGGPEADAGRAQEQEAIVRLDDEILARLRDSSRNGGSKDDDFAVAVKLVNTTIKYGEAIILNKINWEVRKGERWNVSGPNGAGKSTILSLITADNPQAYANEIWLFDRRRGTGETIWEIKRKIGFVSPELHLYFDSGVSCFEVVASGLFDTIGLFRPLTMEQEETVMLWMRLLSLQELRGKRLVQLSTGQQRMVLLARALIKNPPMLILDEPCQGLDEAQTDHFRALITALCEAFDKTLVYVSHYRQELPVCIDRFLQLDKGEIVTLMDS